MNFFTLLKEYQRKIYLFVLLCIIISTAYSILSLSLHKNTVIQEMPIQVETYTVKAKTITKKVNSIATVQYKDKAIISSKIFGRVEKIFVEQSTHIKKGQLLAKIETYTLELQLKEATAELKKAQATLRLAEEKLLQAERNVEQRLKAIAKSKLELTDKYVTLQNTEDILRKKEKLFKAGGVTETELNTLRTNYHTVKTQFLQAKKDYETLIVGFRDSDIAKAGFIKPQDESKTNELLKLINTAMEQAERDAAKSQVEQAKTRIDIIKTNINEASITSPIDGIVAVRSIDIGEKVSEDTNLFVIINTSKVYCISQLNENDLIFIQPGQKAEITIDALSKTYYGNVEIVSPVLDQTSRTADVKIICSNHDNNLKPGMFARVSINVQTISNAICIPAPSLKESDSSSVFIIKNNMAFEKKVTVKERINEEILVDGLQEGDIIASSQIKLLYDKAKVKPISKTN
ncbi:MAG: efflux RND transporter periplasmic adaptor subunit [Spirochaetota bacterium]